MSLPFRRRSPLFSSLNRQPYASRALCMCGSRCQPAHEFSEARQALSKGKNARRSLEQEEEQQEEQEQEQPEQQHGQQQEQQQEQQPPPTTGARRFFGNSRAN